MAMTTRVTFTGIVNEQAQREECTSKQCLVHTQSQSLHKASTLRLRNDTFCYGVRSSGMA